MILFLTIGWSSYDEICRRGNCSVCGHSEDGGVLYNQREVTIPIPWASGQGISCFSAVNLVKDLSKRGVMVHCTNSTTKSVPDQILTMRFCLHCIEYHPRADCRAGYQRNHHIDSTDCYYYTCRTCGCWYDWRKQVRMEVGSWAQFKKLHSCLVYFSPQPKKD